MLGAGFALATVIGAPVAIEVVAGDGFETAVDVLRVQGLAMLASFLLATWGFALISLHLHKELLLANLSALIVSAALVLVLGSAEGARGAAWATLAGESVLAAAYLFGLARGRRELLPRMRALPRVAIATAAGAAVVLAGMPALPATLASLTVFTLVALAVGAVPDELIAWVRGRWR